MKSKKFKMESTNLKNIFYTRTAEDLVFDDGLISGIDSRETDGLGNITGKKYILRLRDLPQNEKPREKLLKYGVSALSVAELLALLLNAGTKKEDVLAMSRRLLKEYGENALISEKDPKKIQKALGIPLVKAY